MKILHKHDQPVLVYCEYAYSTVYMYVDSPFVLYLKFFFKLIHATHYTLHIHATIINKYMYIYSTLTRP